MNVGGFWLPEWSSVVDAFTDNFNDSGEDGAAVAIYHRGELMVNIWAGERDNRLAGIANQPWEENTLVNIFSAGKGLVALCVLQLVAQGKLNLDAPVANYWPEFASAYYNRAVARNRLQQKDLACDDLRTAERLGLPVDAKVKKSICGN